MLRTQEAFQDALATLRRRERSVAELCDWLRGRDFEEAEIEETVSRLTELGELDDERFARRFAEDKRDLRGWGAERIREALLRRGVERDLVERALADQGGQAELERALGLLQRRGGRLEGERDRSRALGFLARRGYSSELAHAAIRAFERGD